MEQLAYSMHDMTWRAANQSQPAGEADRYAETYQGCETTGSDAPKVSICMLLSGIADESSRLAPLDHIRNLYAGAVAELPAGKQRKILQKRVRIILLSCCTT